MTTRHAVRFVLLVLSLAFVAPPAHAVGGIGDLYVTSDASNLTRGYAGATGSFLGVHLTSVAPASGQLAIHFGDVNGRVLVGHFSGGVNEFDATTGAFIKTYNPGGGWMWSAIYRPNGNVYVASTSTDEVLEYDGTTGAFIRVLATFPPGFMPSDMRFGPNGHLYVCMYGGSMVYELHPNSGAILGLWPMPIAGDRANDIAFLPSGDILVTAMGSNLCWRFDSTPAHNVLGSFAGTGWNRPHGIDIGPTNGHVYIVDGVTTQVHEFDPVTFAELNPAWLTPSPGDKIVDLEFRRVNPATETAPSTWGRLKARYR